MTSRQSQQTSSCGCNCNETSAKTLLPFPPLFHAEVIRKQKLGSSRVRLTIGGEDVAALSRHPIALSPGSWIKLYVNTADGLEAGRAYTLHNISPDFSCFDIDVVLHEGGLVSNWSQVAQVGDKISFTGPRHGGFVLHSESQWIVLIGDESALPAIKEILASIPHEVTTLVWVEVEHINEYKNFRVGNNVSVHWLSRQSGPASAGLALIQALERSQVLPGIGQAWIAGESGSVATIQSFLRLNWNMETDRIRGKGYWKHEKVDFRSSHKSQSLA